MPRTAFVALSALGAMVLLAGINAHPVGRDEAVSLLLVAHPVGQIVSLLAAHEVHPAGYFLLLWAWPHANLVEARLLSWVAAVACVPVMMLAAARLGLRRPWLTGLLVACSPFLAYEGTDTRMYAALALFGAAALLAVASLPERPGWGWPMGLGALLAAGMYLHYFAAFTALGVLAVLLIRRRFALAGQSIAVAAVLFLPGLLLLVAQAGVLLRYPTETWQERLNAHGLNTIIGLLFGGAEYDPYGRRLALFLFLPAAYGMIRAPRPVQVLLIFGAGLPLLLGLFTATLTARYLAPMAPILVLCLAVAIDSLPRLAVLPAAAAATLLSLVLVGYLDVRYDTLKPPTPELLTAARAAGAEYVVGHRHFAPQAAYYAPGGEAFAFNPPAVDHVGLWAMSPGLPYPPPPGKPVLAVDYCEGPAPIPAGYRVTRTWVNSGADFCAWLAVPPGT
ncbi:MAG: glycosyltransferase family 39 protein [Candidatus Dormibacteraeota bacterium]|nr:glycosyltransferase family 39 protein [Candidatus Dormibacteraeota bacterium]